MVLNDKQLEWRALRDEHPLFAPAPWLCHIKDAGEIPGHGNQRSKWDAGCRFDHPNPLYR